jgi:hypothetical protein
MALEIKVLAWDRHKHMAALNQLFKIVNITSIHIKHECDDIFQF